MCGSSGKFGPYVPGQVDSQVQTSRRNTEEAEYDQEIGERLRDFSRDVNEPRDVATINERLAEIKQIIEEYIDDTIALRFGGSVSRRTYVEGLSDVDELVLLKPEQFSADDPQDLLREFETLLRRMLPATVLVERGDLAVTLKYADDDLELQLLPALGTATGVRIASTEGDGWSSVIHPDRFARRLTQINQATGGRVVPLIKVVKPLVDQFPSEMRPRGHHIEALAMAAFESYDGSLTTKGMLEHFFEHAANRVRIPLRDQTGQSDYLDDYLGARNSDARQRLSNELDQISGRLQSANDDLSTQAWLDALGL